MNLAVIGSGGREHSICYKLKQSSKLKKLICIPGNAGTKNIAENINEDISRYKDNVWPLYLADPVAEKKDPQWFAKKKK